MNFCVLEKFARLHAVFEIFLCEEMVVYAIFFSVTSGSCGAGDGVMRFTLICDPAAKGGFP